MLAHNDSVLGNVLIKDKIIHETADGKRFLVLYGDQFDSVVKNSRLMAIVGSKLYDCLLSANQLVSYIRYKLNLHYWSLAAAIKHKVT